MSQQEEKPRREMSDLRGQVIIGKWHFQLTKGYRFRFTKNKHYDEFKHRVSFIRFTR